MKKQAVIFDMDGVIIDSEPLWQQAQIRVLAAYKTTINAQDCIHNTMGKRIDALAQTWIDLYSLPVENMALQTLILDELMTLVAEHGGAMPGLYDLLDHLIANGIRIALATSSNHRLIDAVMAKLNIADYFEVICSAEDEVYGKPHPAVYLSAISKLGLTPSDCYVIEDSLTGLIAAKAATVQTFLVSHEFTLDKFAFADFRTASLSEVICHIQ